MSTPPEIPEPDWSKLFRNTKVVDLAAVREMQEAHGALFDFEGPPEIGHFVRLFRIASLFGFISMQSKRFPILNRAFADLQWVQRHPAADEFSVNSYLFLDLPVTEDGRTVADVFAAEVGQGDPAATAFGAVVRASRYGLYQDVGGTGRSQRLQELLTGRRVTVMRSINGDPSEVFWTRIIEWGGARFMLGDVRSLPGSKKHAAMEMLRDRLAGSRWWSPGLSEAAVYEKFMKLACPYWFSVFYSQSEQNPILQPDHDLRYQQGPVPALPLESMGRGRG